MYLQNDGFSTILFLLIRRGRIEIICEDFFSILSFQDKYI